MTPPGHHRGRMPQPCLRLSASQPLTIFVPSLRLSVQVRELARTALWEDPDNDSESYYEYEEEDEGEEGEESFGDFEAGRDNSMLENSTNGMSDSNSEEELVKAPYLWLIYSILLSLVYLREKIEFPQNHM
nr:ankyrin repeat domain-containing protein EMB506, chloroplastic [Ipomoea trifida]